jgi:hypothetical protein
MTDIFELRRMVQKSECGGGNEETEEIITIKGKPVIDIYESFDGSYWFIIEKCHKQDSIIDRKVYKDDQILFGYVKLSTCPEFAEFGYISETELRLLAPRVWKVPRRNWAFCPEVEVRTIDEKTSGYKGDAGLCRSSNQYSKSSQGGNQK